MTVSPTESSQEGPEPSSPQEPEEPAEAPEISVVLPCLNEAETLAVCIEKATQSIEEHDIDGEVIVADNGSTDGSQEIARKHGARVVDVPEKGYGAALMGGFRASNAKYCLQADADDSYDLESVHVFLEKLREGYDFVIGNRFEGGIEEGAMPFTHKYLGNPVLSFIGRLFFDSDIGDFHCGIRAFDREKMLALDLQTPGMEFASEMVVKATIHDLKIAEIPTTLSPDGRSGDPHLNTWSDGWRHLRFLLMYSPKWLFLLPGFFMILFGLAIGGWLWVAPPIEIGPLSFNIHTMLYSAVAILIGFQLVWFSVFSKFFGVHEKLLPEDGTYEWMESMFTLERGLISGVLFSVAGLVGSVYSVYVWQQTGFGGLDPTSMLRLVIPSATALALGVQVIFSSFFLSTLQLGTE